MPVCVTIINACKSTAMLTLLMNLINCSIPKKCHPDGIFVVSCLCLGQRLIKVPQDKHKSECVMAKTFLN